MAEPQDNVQVIPPVVDPEAQAAEVAKLASEIASKEINTMKESLGAALGGQSQSRYGKNGPESWDKLQDDTVSIAVTKAKDEAKKEVLAEIDARDKAREDQQKQTAAQSLEKQKEEYAEMSRQWGEAVDDGIIPPIGKDVAAKIKSGVKFADLTDDEQNDPGLKAYNEARMLHAQLKKEGKSSSFYRTIDKFYNRQPAGMRAPVLGGQVPTRQETDDYTYEDVVADRKKAFNF